LVSFDTEAEVLLATDLDLGNAEHGGDCGVGDFTIVRDVCIGISSSSVIFCTVTAGTGTYCREER
jgi:hypothetical protein